MRKAATLLRALLVAAVGCFAAAATAAPAFAQPADLILRDAIVVTLADEGDRATALAIRGAHILAVGDDASVMAHQGEGTEIIALDGATVIPGLIDNHVHYVRAAGGDPERFAATAAALNERGVTSVLDAGGFNFTDAMADAVRMLDAEGRLTVRVFQMAWPGRPAPDDAVPAMRALLAAPDTDGLARSGGVGEALYRPMHDNPARAFAPTGRDREIATALLGLLAESDTQLHLHTRTETGTRTFLRLFQDAAPGAAARLGWTLHHLENASPETIAMIADVGAHAAVHPRGDRTAMVDGERSLRPPVALFEDARIVWGLGTDATGGARGLFDLIAFAAGEGHEGAANAVSREAALRAATANNARIVGAADTLGVIAPGRLADLAVIDHDITAPDQPIGGTNVLMTVVNGAIVFCNGI